MEINETACLVSKYPIPICVARTVDPRIAPYLKHTLKRRQVVEPHREIGIGVRAALFATHASRPSRHRSKRRALLARRRGTDRHPLEFHRGIKQADTVSTLAQVIKSAGKNSIFTDRLIRRNTSSDLSQAGARARARYLCGGRAALEIVVRMQHTFRTFIEKAGTPKKSADA
jgi:hypothetical protein